MAITINGSGTVTGISVGGLPDGIVDDGTLATNARPLNEIENNIAMLGFYRAADNSKAVFNMVDSVVDTFTDATGIDTGNSTNENLTSGYYSGSSGTPSTKITNATAIGDMTIGSGLSSAFDGTTSTNWQNSARKDPSYDSKIGQDWGSGNSYTVTKFVMYGPDNYPLFGQTASKYYKLQGSTNNSTWVDLYTDSNTTTAYDAIYTVTSGIVTSTAYRYHRIYGEGDNNGGAVTELEFYQGGQTIGNLTLQSTATTADTTPTTGDIVMLLEDAVGTATLNTDIKGYVSRDGGTTWTQGTLTDEGGWGTNKKVLAFHNLDISAQPSGTSMKYKVTTHNQSASKETRVHATSLAWA